jgi:hypothetical protein
MVRVEPVVDTNITSKYISDHDACICSRSDMPIPLQASFGFKNILCFLYMGTTLQVIPMLSSDALMGTEICAAAVESVKIAEHIVRLSLAAGRSLVREQAWKLTANELYDSAKSACEAQLRNLQQALGNSAGLQGATDESQTDSSGIDGMIHCSVQAFCPDYSCSWA